MHALLHVIIGSTFMSKAELARSLVFDTHGVDYYVSVHQPVITPLGDAIRGSKTGWLSHFMSVHAADCTRLSVNLYWF